MFDGSISIAWAFFASSVLSFELAMHAWTKRRNAYSNAFFGVMAMAGFWSLCSGMHLVLQDFDMKVLVSNVKFVFIVPLPVTWALMAAWFTDIRISKRTAVLLYVLPAITLVLIATNSWHHAVFAASTPFEQERFTTIAREYGPWFWVNMAYAYVMVLAGFLLFLRKVVTSRGYVRVQAVIMMAGSAMPLLSNALYFLGPGAFLYLDWTPVSFAASGVFFYLGMFRYRMLDLMPIAREEIIRSMEDGVVITDPDGHILETNDATGRLIENGQEAASGRHVTAVFPFLSRAWKVSANKNPLRMELPREVDGDRRWMVVRIRSIFNDADVLQGKMVLLRDVTERKEAEIHLVESRERIQELSRLKSAFLSNMSHDVRTPLSGIIGLADVLMEETEGDQNELAGMIRTSGDRLLKLLNSILSVSHLSSGTLDKNIEPTNVVSLAKNVLVQIERDAEEKGLELNESVSSDMIVRHVDPAHVAHALSHIFDHAVRFTEYGSISMDIREKNDDVMIRITDTGKGFDPAFVASIDQPIDSMSLAEFGLDKGSGLGLRVAHGLIQECGGQLLISSEPGKGSVFTIVLSQKDIPSNPDRPPAGSKADHAHPGKPDYQTDPA